MLLVLGPRVLPEFRDPNAGRLDLVSVALSLAAVLAAIYGLKQIAQDGIGAVPVASIVAGLALGLVFARRQRTLDDPMIDLDLFRVRAFNAALATNVLGIFIAIGYFLFIAQYLQLVLGLSPLRAGLWSLPSAAGFIVGSNAAPRIARLVRPAILIGAGLLMGALGLFVLIELDASSGLSPLVLASVVISLGLAPVFTVTTELIVGSAPPERAGAASGISETGAELGGALGISILGSIGVAVYRGAVAGAIPVEVPSAAADAARDTLGGAVEVAAGLPDRVGGPLLEAAREAFTRGMHVAALIGAIVAFAIAILAGTMLRHVPRSGGGETAGAPEAPEAGDAVPAPSSA
jgi:DHA2 family multidrug resistance protein-like MFS transporter